MTDVIEPGTQAEQVTADDLPYDFRGTSRWAEFSRPPPTALKTITGGRLTGLTDINPQWRLKAMDAAFGLCGHGWKYEITSLDRFVCDNGEIIQFAAINVYTRNPSKNGEPFDGSWGAAIPGTGGSKLASIEKGRLHFSDEAQKMAITDALSVAFKAMGVGSEVYEGRWDGSKYRDNENIPEPVPTDSTITKRLETCLSQSELQFEWQKLSPEQRKAHQQVKDLMKEKLAMVAGTGK